MNPADILLPPDVPVDQLRWAWRVNAASGASSRGYVWPGPGHWAEPAEGDRSIPENATGCPWARGDGLCLAVTYDGARSGTREIHHGRLCAYLEMDVLGVSWNFDPPGDTDYWKARRAVVKIRVRRAWVAATFDMYAEVGCLFARCHWNDHQPCTHGYRDVPVWPPPGFQYNAPRQTARYPPSPYWPRYGR